MTIATTLAAVAAWMLTYLVHSTIFIGVALLLARRLRDRPEHMSGIWKLALVGGVLTATVQVGLGVTPVSGRVALAEAPVRVLEIESLPSIEPVDDEAVLAVAGLDTLDPLPDLDSGAEPPAPSIDAAALAPVEVTSPAPKEPATSRVPVPHAASSSAAPSWSVVLAIIGLVGAVLGLLSVALAVRGLRRRLADRTPVPEGALLRMFRELLVRTGVRRRVALSVSRSTTVPLAMGIARPEIVLPERATVGLERGQQHTMLAHELAHVFRHDPAWRMVALLAERVFFFQPLNRIATARMTECAEYLCDDWAARHTDERLALAQCLTEVASWVGASPVVLASAMAGSSSQLRHRVLRLLAPARPVPGAKAVGIVAALAVAAVAWLAPGVSSGETARVVGAIPRVSALMAAPVHAHDDAEVRVWTSDDGKKVVIIGADEDDAPAELVGDAAAPNDDPKAARRAKRRAVKANREAERALDKAMRKARREGRAAPTNEEVQSILSQARKQAGQRESGERVALRFEVSDSGTRIEIEGGTRGHVLTIDDLVAEAHRRHAHAHGQAAKARAHGEKEARKAMKEAMKARKRAHHDIEHTRRRLQQKLRSQDLPPEARRAIERALRDFERSMGRADDVDPFWIAVPPEPPMPASPPTVMVAPRAPGWPPSGRVIAPPAPPSPFAAEPPSAPESPFPPEAPRAPSSPFPGADAPLAPPAPPGIAPSPPQRPRARSRRGFAPPASPRARGRAPVAPAPPSPPHDIQPIVWTY